MFHEENADLVDIRIITLSMAVAAETGFHQCEPVSLHEGHQIFWFLIAVGE